MSFTRFKAFMLRYYIYFFYLASFFIPFLVYLRTMNPTTSGSDTTWLHIQVPLLYVGQTTGFPLAFLTGKLFSFLPIGTMAYRLNLYSVFWGAMTVFILFLLTKNILKKEYHIALISVLFFGFFRVFWFQTARFEVYTLNTFLVSLIMLTGFYWTENKKNKFLYLFYFLVGLSFTNHPISLFLSPAFILFPIYTDWKQVFKIKKFFIILALIISPNLLYLYLPIRSFQGYGNITSFERFLSFISGDRWRGQFGFKGFELLLKTLKNYLSLMKGDLTIPVLFIFLIGLVYLAMRKRKYFILIVSLIILNFIPILLYTTKPNDFYLTTLICFLCIPFAAGLFGIKEGIAWFFNRFIRPSISRKYISLKKEGKNARIYIIIFLTIFFISISIFPIYLFGSNFKEMDQSKETFIYDYWMAAVRQMEVNSIVVSNSQTAHVAIYIDRFETHKNLEILRDFDLNMLENLINENRGKRSIYYTDAGIPDLSGFYLLEQIGPTFNLEGFEETFNLYKIIGEKVNIEITSDGSFLQAGIGEKIVISYYIKNNSQDILNITSLELELPKALKFIDMDKSSGLETSPGLARGFYMWTSGPYRVEPGKVFRISVICQANDKWEGDINFRITTGNMYVQGPDINISIK